jgi:outer membrane protein
VLSTTRNYTNAQSKYSKSRYAYILNGVRLKNASSILSVTDLEAINRYLK